MKSSVEPLEGNKVKVYVEVDEAEFDKDIDQAFRKIAAEVKLPGFRNGKAPRRVLEARIGVGTARAQALNDAIPLYLGRAVREHDVDLIATPEVELTGGGESGPVEFEASCEIRPVITVPGYDGLRIELDSPVPTDDEIAEAEQAELRKSGTLSTVERPAAAGDVLTIDLSATRDGADVAGLNVEDWSYELGKGWVTDDFDERLTGASAGDVLTFTATPKGSADPADFTVSVTMVQELEIPVPTDEWVSEQTGEYESVDEWRLAIAERVATRKLAVTRQQVMGRVTDALVALVEIDAPESMVVAEARQQVENLIRQLQMQGIDPSTWFSATGADLRQMIDDARPQAATAVKADLALRAVAVAEGLDVSDDDLELEFVRMAMRFNQKAKDIRRAYEQNDLIPDLVAQIRKSKSMDWLLHHVEMVAPDGSPIDRDLVLGHDDHDHDHHDHDHDHDHDDDHEHGDGTVGGDATTEDREAQ